MASVVLAVNNHATLISSIWGDWAGAPHDLLLVTEVNITAVLCFVTYLRMELLKPTVTCSSHCLVILLLLLRL